MDSFIFYLNNFGETVKSLPWWAGWRRVLCTCEALADREAWLSPDTWPTDPVHRAGLAQRWCRHLPAGPLGPVCAASPCTSPPRTPPAWPTAYFNYVVGLCGTYVNYYLLEITIHDAVDYSSEEKVRISWYKESRSLNRSNFASLALWRSAASPKNSCKGTFVWPNFDPQ